MPIKISVLTTLVFSLTIGCTDKENKLFTIKESTKTDTTTSKILITEDYTSQYFDSLRRLKFDTTTLDGKINAAINSFYIDKSSLITFIDKDTLFDINYDGLKDLVLFYYGHSGTGLKNIADIYLYNKSRGRFEKDTSLSGVYNPSFYIKNKTITWFYIGHGGGEGGMLKWGNHKWQPTKLFYFDNRRETEDAEILIIDTKRGDTVKQYFNHYVMIPSDNILKNEYN